MSAWHAQIVLGDYGWGVGLAIDVALVSMLLAVIAIPVAAVALFVRFLARGRRPASPADPLDDLRAWEAKRQAGKE